MEVGTSAFKRTIITDQYAILAHGKAEKEWPFIACSDSKITDSEFEKWKRTIQSDNMRQPTKRFLSEKLERIHQLLNRSWTEESLAEKFARQNKFAKYDGPVIGLQALQQKNSPEKKTLSQGDRLAILNRSNRQKNIEEIRRAQIVEMKKEKNAQNLLREKAAREAKEKEDKEAGLQVPGVDDLFEGGSDLSRTGTPQPEKKEKKKLEMVKGIATFRKRNMDDDILGSMDLGIDIEI
jgi:RNA polymerase-associated protein RTF1